MIVKLEKKFKSKEKVKTEPLLSYFRVFRYCTKWDYFVLGIALVLSIIKSSMMALVIIIYSEFCACLIDRVSGIGTSTETVLLSLLGGGKILVNATEEENYAEIQNDSFAYGIMLSVTCLIMFLAGIFSIDIFNYCAIRQITKIKIAFFQSIITQEIGWHDVVTDQNFASRVTDDMEKIRDGIAEKACHFFTLITGFLISAVVAFIYGWKLTLAVSIYIPLVIVLTIVVSKIQGKLTIKEMNVYAKASSILEEILSGIRTVVAFHGEEKESERYEKYLHPAKRAGRNKGIFSGFSDGVLRSLLFLSCSGAFWYGIHLILEDRYSIHREYTPSTLMIAFFGILVGAENISRTSPFLEAFSAARGAATNIFKIIDRVSKINPLESDGKILNSGLKGEIEFQDVFFKYPSREEITILRGINFKVASGETVALVGNSGCGKSTCIQLVQRFYDPIFGQVLLDKQDVKQYNLSWLRSNIGVVGQEPVLFATTIGENIRYGKFDATQMEIESAARASGIHDFIASLPNSYSTMIGERGAQLSGGQKQRIAIARALIQNPKILLLDEATSALDYQSEQLVQEALDRARKGRTTIVVSHRLSAIKGADRIIFIEKGKAAEEGSHDTLMKLQGKYYNMVTAGGLGGLSVETENEKNLKIEDVEKDFNLKMNNIQDKKILEQLDVKKLSVTSLKTKIENLELPEQSYSKTFRRIILMAKPEWPYLILGTITALLYGCSYPCFSILFGDFFGALTKTDDNEVREDIRILCIMFLVVGIAAGVVCFLQTYLFSMAGVWITLRLRSKIFRSIMKQDMAWFDRDENNVGALSAQFAGDIADFHGSIGYPLSCIIQGTSNIVLATIIAFYYSWKLALVCYSVVPFIVGIVIYEAKLMANSTVKEKIILEETSSTATEAITNIRTIASLRHEPFLIERYSQQISNVEQRIKKKYRLRGTVNSFGQSVTFFGYAVALWYGGVLVSEKEVELHNIIKVSEALLYGSMMLGQSLAFTPAFTVAIIAGQRLFKLLDRKPRIQSQQMQPYYKGTNRNQDFNVKYSNVDFRYPKRPEQPILQGLNLEIMQGKTVALVGNSGCGKSTCVQLLQRFYDPDKGKVLIGSCNISKDLSLDDLRSQLSIVSQEPVLFERTIAENIAYGDNSRQVNLTEIIEVAKMSNIHSFIISLPNGYDTLLGSKGTQLSGGEKQRIAIARALVRNPKILLLDEATSALDLQSEKLVQSALDLACTGRTCIVIAHRLSTIQTADVICVIDNGKVIEQGTHQTLLTKGGAYARLHKMQPGLE